jgi:hypothetical protein
MPEITRTEIQQENSNHLDEVMAVSKLDRSFVHSEDVSQVAEIKRALDQHIKLQKINDESVGKKIDSLLPLVDLIPVLNCIVQKENDNKAVSKYAVKIGRGIGFVAVVVSSIGVIIGAAWVIISAIIDIKK